MKQGLHKAANVVCTVIIVVAVLVLVRTVFVPSGQVPTIGGYGALRVLSGSMEPEIPTNSLIVIHEVDAGSLHEGDVITFYSNEPGLDGLVNTHRIVAIGREKASDELLFTTKGDANGLADEQPVPASNVIGKVVFVSGILGLLVSLLSNPLVFVPVILIPLGIILILEIRSTARAAQEVARKEEEEALRETVRKLRSQREAQGQSGSDSSEPEAKTSEVGHDQ